MSEPFPDWPTPLKRFIDSAHLHALGQLTFVYNLLKEAFGYLFVRYYPTSREFAVNRYLGLNNRKRIHLLRELVQTSETDEAVKAAVLTAVVGFDICTNNRNILAHSMVESDADGALKLGKRKSKSSGEFVFYEMPLQTLRRAADETADYFAFVEDLEKFLSDREVVARDETMDWKPRRLPEIPPPPHRVKTIE
jgi:hypothetical protein